MFFRIKLENKYFTYKMFWTALNVVLPARQISVRCFLMLWISPDLHVEGIEQTTVHVHVTADCNYKLFSFGCITKKINSSYSMKSLLVKLSTVHFTCTCNWASGLVKIRHKAYKSFIKNLHWIVTHSYTQLNTVTHNYTQ